MPEAAPRPNANFRLFESLDELQKPKPCPHPVIGATVFGLIAFSAFAVAFGVQFGTFAIAVVFGIQIYHTYKAY